MDPIAIIFYAIVCGALSWAGPHFGNPLVRAGAGVAVGVAAASLLPVLKAAIA